MGMKKEKRGGTDATIHRIERCDCLEPSLDGGPAPAVAFG